MVKSEAIRTTAELPSSGSSAVRVDPSLMSSDGDALGRLLEAEREHIERLAAADREAEAILAEARRSAAQREEAFRGELDLEIAGLERALVDECEREIAGTVETARREAARFDGMTEAQIAVLAEALLDLIFSGAFDRAEGASP